MMSSRRLGLPAATGLALGLLVLMGPVQGHAGRASVRPAAVRTRPACCYSNPQYSGVCAVQPGQAETCASILAYLNDPRSQGKSYCGNTSIRGGWKRIRCDRPQAGRVDHQRAACRTVS